jgi:hypothetical protein
MNDFQSDRPVMACQELVRQLRECGVKLPQPVADTFTRITIPAEADPDELVQAIATSDSVAHINELLLDQVTRHAPCQPKSYSVCPAYSSTLTCVWTKAGPLKSLPIKSRTGKAPLLTRP